MNDLLNRFHRLKLVLASVVLTVVGIVLILVGNTLSESHSDGWVSLIPWNELGGIIIGAGLLSIWIDQLFRREQEALTDRRLRQLLHDHAPTMRDAVLKAFAANREDLVRVATPETLDRIIANSLALRLDDEQFAHEVFTDIREQAVTAPERWHDLKIDVDLSPMIDHPGYFAVTVRREYSTVPAFSHRTFVCTSSKREYAELARGSSETRAWYLRPNTDFAASDRSAYEVVQFTVNGEERPIRRASRKNYQAYSVELGDDATSSPEPMAISQTFRTITRANGNLLFFDIEQPTRNISISLDYTGTGIETVSVIDHLSSVRPTRIERSPEEVPTRTVRLEMDGWAFPRAGVAFVWSLADPGASTTAKKQTKARAT